MGQPSRIEDARRRLRRARFGIGACAAAGFALFVFAARAAHPGTSAAAPNVTQQSFSSDDGESSNSSGFDFGSGSIGPSGGGFSVQSGGS
jgi:hypothetical protein